MGQHSARAPYSAKRRAPQPSKRPLWRRTPILPATALVLAVWGGTDAYQVIHDGDGAANASVAQGPIDLSALATNHIAGTTESDRVSRGTKRTSLPQPAGSASLDGASAAGVDSSALPSPLTSTGPSATAMPARPSLPKVDPGKTVAGVWVRPSAGGMSSCFCMRWGVMHEGIDLAGPLGSPIVAAGDGVVLEAGPEAGFGHWIVIQHSNGDVTVYGHMYSVLVSKGEHVTAGQHIADVGADGEATGPHLHFAVMKGKENGPYIDPVPWLRARGVDVGAYNPNA